MEPAPSLLSPSQTEASRISWIQSQTAGPAPAPAGSFAAGDGHPAPTKKRCSFLRSNTSESSRLSNLLDRKIQRRLRKQKEVHKIDKELGDMMRLFRSNAGLTLASMAYKLNLSFPYLHAIEQGQRSATLADLHAIFSVYGIDVASQIKAAKKGV